MGREGIVPAASRYTPSSAELAVIASQGTQSLDLCDVIKTAWKPLFKAIIWQNEPDRSMGVVAAYLPFEALAAQSNCVG